MKVIHLILGKANPERMNGVNKVVHALATQQCRAGWNAEVWGITQDVVENYPPRDFTTRLFRACRNPFQVHPELVSALTQMAGQAVVHLHGGFIPAYYSAAKKLTELGIHYVVTPHGSYSAQAMRKNGLVKQLYLRLCERHLLQGAALVHCLGQSEVTGLRGLRAGLPTCLLPYGFEMPLMEVCRTEPRGIFRVGFCGRLDEKHKGLSCLIAGFAEFAQHMPSAELWIIGDGPDREKVERWAAAVPAGKVKVLGSRFGNEKMGLLAQLDVFAHPSHYEGLPTAVLEAASLGIPCVVTEATNMGSYIRHFECGQVVEEAQPSQLAAGLRQVYQQWINTPRQQLSQRCHAMVTTAFYWPTLLQEYQRMYRRAYYA
ncbi:glycosyltransferase family 4 protein [Hymenobacter mucosus]|uniref:Glycosyltransferase involved in cell wall bisynthesis n=1 Tax=Hymenobacter mucosus TaxID=1411120 RepID=A0A238ZAA6_9BACT|nr:glycosyltransferase family 4 protein [Hymenobacter mucosus]SNR79664.1 Glycosyltransferase involved in cell wall bisynthesis [Hymenobacter mucosus]